MSEVVKFKKRKPDYYSTETFRQNTVESFIDAVFLFNDTYHIISTVPVNMSN